MSQNNNNNNNNNSNNNNININNNKKKSIGGTKRGIDALLQTHGKHLGTGGSIAFRLVKGPTGTITADPVDPKAPHQAFPVIGKFPESVIKPQFTGKQKTARLYQQDVPKPADDSDDEAEAAATAAAQNNKKKRWKYADREKPRQWILQDEVEFLETMVARRERRTLDPKKVSTRYEGVSESNSSHYALFRVNPTELDDYMQNGHNQHNGEYEDRNSLPSIQLINMPLNCTVTFAQPAARKTLSLTQAEQVITDQRMGLRTMHNVHNEDVLEPKPMNLNQPLRLPNKNKNTSKNRLLGRLQAADKKQTVEGEDDEADDVMGDVTFRNRKGGGAARKELLSTLGDSDLAVTQDGVLGGTNDAAFGMGQRFGNLQTDKIKTEDGGAGGDDAAAGAASSNKERGADGAAMADDFYQRDVMAEYEELDYDAQEQFDDDDVDMAEGEVVVESGGYGGEDEEDDNIDDDALEEEQIGGAEGLASVAGFKLMLAKARGEIPAVPIPGAEGADATAAAAVNGVSADKNSAQNSKAREEENDTLSEIIRAAEEASKKAIEKKVVGAASQAGAAAAIQVDENGQRIITLTAVQKEIWLNHGQIPMKRLMKIFDIKKKSAAERQNKFREVVKELCIMKNDPVGGRLLVLKQHYSSMP